MEYIADDGIVEFGGCGEKMTRVVMMDPRALQDVPIAVGEQPPRCLDAAGRELHGAALEVGKRQRAGKRNAGTDAEEQRLARVGSEEQGQPRLIGLHEHCGRVGRGILAAHVGEQHALPSGCSTTCVMAMASS